MGGLSPLPEAGGVALANLRLLGAGTLICAEMRAQVRRCTGFTLSAGVAPNRLLAKLVSGTHKPDKQTLVAPVAAVELLRTLPLQVLNGFGGKLGAALVEERGIVVLGQLRAFKTAQSLLPLAGGNHNLAQWMWDACRGVDLKPVSARLMSKGIGCGKTFPGAQNLACVWFLQTVVVVVVVVAAAAAVVCAVTTEGTAAPHMDSI